MSHNENKGKRLAKRGLAILGVKVFLPVLGLMITAVVVFSLILSITSSIVPSIATGGGGNGRCVTYNDGSDDDEDDDDDDSGPKSDSSHTISGSAGDTDPFTKGTKAYENAHKVFMAFVDSGLSGEAAAGIIGWINSEGSFDIVGRAQGHYGGGINDSISKGAVPNTGGTSNTLGGGGIFQFDPYTKYAPLNSPDWEDVDKMVAFVINAVANGDWNPAYDESGHNWSFAEFAQQTNIDGTAMAWNAYERGNMAFVKPDQKKGDARKFAEVMEASKYKYNAEKFNKAFKGGAAPAQATKGSSDDDEDDDDDDKDGGSSSSSSSSSGKIDIDKTIQWMKDRAGKVSYAQENRDGPDAYDCTSSIYYALRDAGADDNGYAVNTDSMHDWLLKNDFELAYEGAWSSKDDIQNRQKGDIIIWGHKGRSGGNRGHAMLMLDKENIIHCSSPLGGIAETHYGTYRDRMQMDFETVYVYRPKSSDDSKDEDDCEDDSGDSSDKFTDTGQPLDVPYTINQLYGDEANTGSVNAGTGHTGMDLGAPEGSPIYAVTDGEVVHSGWEEGGGGNSLMHTLPDGTIIDYAHMRDVPLPKVGDKIKKGQLIGYVGMTGTATGPHIHFERRKTKEWARGNFLSPSSIILGDQKPQVGMVIDPKTQKGGAPSKQ